MSFLDLLTEVIRQQDAARERTWALLLPLVAAFVALATFTAFHLPQLTGPSILFLVAFAAVALGIAR